MAKQHGILLDLNVTLNDKGGYCHPSELEIAPWAIEAIQAFNEHGLPMAIVTNQSGIADGKFSHEEFRERLESILTSLERYGAYVETFYYCPHSKEDNCPHKKPKDGMIWQACKDLGVDPQDCFMLGDTGYSDMQTGYGKPSLETPEYRESWQYITPDFIARDLLEAAHWICSSLPKQSWQHKRTKIVSL